MSQSDASKVDRGEFARLFDGTDPLNPEPPASKEILSPSPNHIEVSPNGRRSPTGEFAELFQASYREVPVAEAAREAVPVDEPVLSSEPVVEAAPSVVAEERPAPVVEIPPVPTAEVRADEMANYVPQFLTGSVPKTSGAHRKWLVIFLVIVLLLGLLYAIFFVVNH